MKNRVEILGRPSPLLTAEALEFLFGLENSFSGRRLELMARRGHTRRWEFLPETASVRSGAWKVAPVPALLNDRRVEITGPAEPKMIINALNSGAEVFMADFEDSLSPTWPNVIGGQEALYEAVRRTLTFAGPGAKAYRLHEKTAVLFVRPRGWALEEHHVQVGGRPMSAALFDFGLFFFHNARAQLERGQGPFFYLPKLESHLEARLWNDVFLLAQDALGIPRGTVKATALIETLPAAFEMDEILFELREHSAGLNCGRWDYIFSFIKNQPTRLLPDRAQLTMDKGFLRAYVQKLIQTCHRRGAHAMGGMAAQIPIKDDPVANEQALAKVRADKLREVTDGHDGTWVAHPALVPVAREAFGASLAGPNQLQRLREDVVVTPEDLLRIPDGTQTEAGLRHNIRVGVQYLASWLGGQGCVPLYHLMEDAATAEIARAQVWQRFSLGLISSSRLVAITDEELAGLEGPHLGEARALFLELCTAERLAPFLTVPAYARLIHRSSPSPSPQPAVAVQGVPA